MNASPSVQAPAAVSPANSNALRGISSMATRLLLADLVAQWTARTGQAVEIVSVGGVDAARRVQEGECWDAVFLAADAIDRLAHSGHAVAGTRVDLARSGISVAVQKGAALPDIASEAAVRDLVEGARSVAYSTGPSGVALRQLFARWGVLESLQDRLVQAAPGIPVGTLVAQGQAAVGFQQTSELLNVEGITLLGPLPAAIQIETVFSAAVVVGTREQDAVRALLAFMASPEGDGVKRLHGMEPAHPTGI